MIVLSKSLGSLEGFGKPETTKSGLQTDNQQETKNPRFLSTIQVNLKQNF